MNTGSFAPWGVLIPAEEKRAAKDLSPAVAWPTLAMALVLPLGQWTIVGLGATGAAPLWACVPIITLTSYAHYTLVHEAIHGNLAPGHPRLRWLNALVGWVGALGLGYNWPVLMRGHALHHAHTNTDRDPDLEVKGTLGQLLVKWLLFVPLSLIPPPLLRFVVPAQHRKLSEMLRDGEMLQATAVAAGFLSLLAVNFAMGRFLEPLCLLLIPTRLAALMLRIFFSWLPHHPFDRTERYLNTRNQPLARRKPAFASAEPASHASPVAERALLQLRSPLPATAPHPPRQRLADRGADGGGIRAGSFGRSAAGERLMRIARAASAATPTVVTLRHLH